MKRLLILSTSTVYGKPYLAYAKDAISEFFADVNAVTFIPFARPSGASFDEYTEVARKAFSSFGVELNGVHESGDMKKAAEQAEAFFVGGGNTFLLLKTIYDTGLFPILKSKVENGAPYMGTSAGSNLTGLTINTTNDMPIVYPPSFDAFGFIPFNINPHYLDPIPDSKHMGETRETRINEFHKQQSIPVVGLREGSWLDVKDDEIILKGPLNARIFKENELAKEVETGFNFRNL
jgi:dipeptidase E